MKKTKNREGKAIFTAYIDEIKEIQSLFNEKLRYVIYVKWIMSEEISMDPSMKIRIECKDHWDVGKLSVNDQIEFDACYSISEDGKHVLISKPYRLNRLQ
ncbi:MAG: hypothetical protein K9G38_02705 [Bacteroidales bacterium]|nr:hypothetical protein [Bacteroidales bacterium]